MRKLLILAATTSLIAVSACNREAETAPAADDAAMAADAASADAAGSDASASASRSGGSGGAASASGGAATTSEAIEPVGGATAGDMAAGPGPVTQSTRDNAQAEAEATNLHPRPPAN